MKDSCFSNISSKLHNNEDHWNLIKCACNFQMLVILNKHYQSSHIPYGLLKAFGDISHGLGDFWKG